jgi:hypothetical protein
VRRRRYEPDRLRQARPFMAAYQRLLPGGEPRDWQRFPDAHPDKPPADGPLPVLPADWRGKQPKQPEEDENGGEKHGNRS